MNILHISTSDIVGGAARATYQIHSLLRETDHRSVIAVRRKTTSDSQVLLVGMKSLWRCNWGERIERGRDRFAGGYQVKPAPFHMFNRNLAPVPDWDAVLAEMPKPDIIFLHWITNLMTAADIRRLARCVQCPIVWVLLDMEPMTGGCHYPGNCVRFHTECRDCPQLQKGGRGDWAGRIWQEKFKRLSDLPITFVAPTRWLADRLSASGLFQGHAVEQIPLPIPKHTGYIDKLIARQVLGLPLDKKIILAGSSNLNEPRKGAHHLVEAARILASREREEDIQFVIVGAHSAALAKEIPFSVHELGFQGDIVLSLAYQSADLFACSSVEDAGPMMVSQAMMYGTPVVAFDTGIVPELLTSGEGGYMARLGDVEDFTHGLMVTLNDDGKAGRRAAEIATQHHDPQRIAQAYGDLLYRLTCTSKGSSTL